MWTRATGTTRVTPAPQTDPLVAGWRALHFGLIISASNQLSATTARAEVQQQLAYAGIISVFPWRTRTMRNFLCLVVAASCLADFTTTSLGESPRPDQLRMMPWTPPNMVKDPVAISFDRQGRLYVVETARRSTVDIDMRGHREWLLEDLANDDFASMRAFFRRQMATEKSDDNKDWLQDRNQDGVHDFRDLTTIKERVRVVEDTDGDGFADKSTLFAEGFNEEFNGVAAGVLPYRGDVFFTVYPDLWRLRDHDGDLVADSSESMFRGFGVHAALDGHDLHGLTIGPEGKVYFSCGDNGFSITTQEGRRLHYPNTGGVLRMNPDGSDLEVYAIGLRNVQEFDFDAYGNMFGVDNDGDLEDERERAVYIAEGSDSGWRLNWQFRSPGWSKHNGDMSYNPWTADGMWKPPHDVQPAYITPPMQNYSVGPGGFKFNPGTALNDDYRDFFFCVQFPVKQVTAFRTEPAGAGFRMVDEHVFNAGLMVSSLNFGPDGGFYLADWVGKWQPNGEGLIYRVDDPREQGSDRRVEVKKLINEGVQSKSNEELVSLLGHEDRRVRQLAQYELALGRKQSALLAATASDAHASQLARIHALWGTIQFHQQSAASSALTGMSWLPWKDSDPQIRQQCARVAGDLGLKSAVQKLIELLSDSVPLVRSHAAIAVGKLRSRAAIPSLVELVKQNANRDPFIRHAAIVGLSGCATAEDLEKLYTSSEPVRLAAVVALRRLQSPRVARYLEVSDDLTEERLRVVREAVRAVHDDFSIPLALPKLAKMLDDATVPNDEAIIRRAISANFRLGSDDAAKRIARFICTPPTAMKDELLVEAMQMEALGCLAEWHRTPLVDRVEGRIRKAEGRQLDAGREALSDELPAILAAVDGDVTAEVLRIVAEQSLPINARQLADWVATEAMPVNARVGALRLLAARESQELPSATEIALQDKAAPLHRAAIELVARTDANRAWQHMDWKSPNPALQQFYISVLPILDLPAAKEKLAELLVEHRASTSPSETSLDVYQAARKLDAWADWTQELEKKSRLGRFQLALHGGDALRGRAIYHHHVSAQCVRCHEAGGMGKQAGPPLNGIASRVDRQHLLESLIDPSAKIAAGFGGVTLLLTDGRTLTGTVIDETDSVITLGLANGKQATVSLSEVDERVEATISAMPEMTNVLTPFEIRDVVAYLATRKSTDAYDPTSP